LACIKRKERVIVTEKQIEKVLMWGMIATGFVCVAVIIVGIILL
jgi:hypothetical protein